MSGKRRAPRRVVAEPVMCTICGGPQKKPGEMFGWSDFIWMRDHPGIVHLCSDCRPGLDTLQLAGKEITVARMREVRGIAS